MATKTNFWINLAGRTVEYGPLNWPITARVLTERFNKMWGKWWFASYENSQRSSRPSFPAETASSAPGVFLSPQCVQILQGMFKHGLKHERFCLVNKGLSET